MQRLYASIRVSRAVDPEDAAPGNGREGNWRPRTTPSTRFGPASGSAVAPACTRSTRRPAASPVGSSATTRADGSLDLDQAVSGELELAVERLTSGNQLYDRELRRRIDARRHPDHRRPGHQHHFLDGAHPVYDGHRGDPLPRQDEDFFARDADRGARRRASRSRGDVFDIREFGMKPPSMLMVRVYPEISVRVELHGTLRQVTCDWNWGRRALPPLAFGQRDDLRAARRANGKGRPQNAVVRGRAHRSVQILRDREDGAGGRFRNG